MTAGTLASCHTEAPGKKVYADKGYYGEPNRSFLHLNEIEDGLRLVGASLRLGEDHAQGYERGENNEERD